jgi:hypothetical protein
MAARYGSNGALSLEAVCDLMEKATSLRVVSDFLKSRDLPASAGSWEDLYKLRIKPAVDSHKLSVADLINFLVEVEAYGRSHIFLFGCGEDIISKLVDPQNVADQAKVLGLSSLVNGKPVLSQPDKPTITEIRTGGTSDRASVTIKLVERREETKLIDQKTNGAFVTKTWEIVPARAVNVFRLWGTRILEVRVQSRSGGSTYQEDIDRLWGTDVRRFFPPDEFSPIPLTNIKSSLWKDRLLYKNLLRFSDSRVKNDHGITVSAATGDDDSDLSDDSGAEDSVNAFLKKGGYWASSNVWWKSQENGIPSRDIHVLLSGQSNEFAVTANCNRVDYEYVLGELARIGGKAP